MNTRIKIGALVATMVLGACSTSTSTSAPHPKEFNPPLTVKGKHWEDCVEGSCLAQKVDKISLK